MMDKLLHRTLESATDEKQEEVKIWIEENLEIDPINFLYRLAEIYLLSTNSIVAARSIVILEYIRSTAVSIDVQNHAHNVLVMLEKVKQEAIPTYSLLRSIRYMLSIKSEF